MPTDYKKLCAEIFGTTDEQKLREIASAWKQNPRQKVGRKKKFSEKDIEDMRRMRADGASVEAIAKKYGTSRQVIGRYLVKKPAPGCTMRIMYMNRHRVGTIIDLDFLAQKVYIQNFTDEPLDRAFGIRENPTWEDWEEFLADRCFPKTRGNCKELLQNMGLTDYDPLQIVEQTHGRMAEDDYWMKIRTFGRTRNEYQAG